MIFKNCLKEFAAERHPGAFFAMANEEGFDRHEYWEELRRKKVKALVSKDGLRSYYNTHDVMRPYFFEVYDFPHHIGKKEYFNGILTMFFYKYDEKSKPLAITASAVERIIECAIDYDDASALADIANCGYIKKAEIDKHIKYASESEKHETLAYLLDWQNKNIDLAKKQQKEERKIQKFLETGELSVEDLRKIWTVIYKGGQAIITGYKGHDAVIAVPSKIGAKQVGSILSDTFNYNQTMTKITLPDGLTEIESRLFSGCKNLSQINLPKNLSKIGYNAFYGCVRLSKIELPESLREIGRHAFEDCGELSEINFPGGLVKIDDGAFSGCIKLSVKNINFPESPREIGRGVFSKCNLNHIKIKEIKLPDSVEKIGGLVFSDGRWREKISYDEVGKIIGLSLFGECNFTEIELPTGLVKIESGAFRDCKKLVKMTLPDGVVEIENYAFSYCEELNEINLPASINKMAWNSFSDCKKLTVICSKDSYAHKYCKEHKINCKIV